MAPIVNCHVANCAHWSDGNKCGADEILVQTDAHEDYSTELSNELSSDEPEYAGESAETCCHTFKPKH